MGAGERQLSRDERVCIGFLAVLVICMGICVVYAMTEKSDRPNIELASTDFTVLNITQSRLSAKWDLSIRIPYYLPCNYICLQGDLQASILYKNVTLATSSPQKYMDLRPQEPQILKLSTLVSQEDISGLVGKDFMEDIKDRKEVQFGFRFFLTDCREETTGVMSFKCDEVTLRFEPSSETKATLFGKHPKCKLFETSKVQTF